jgi:hypothetical protein
MLRSVNELKNYAVRGNDGGIGSLDDFYLDDESWTIRYFAGTSLSGRKFLVTPAALGCVNAQAGTLELLITRAQIENSPTIETQKPVSRHHEKALLDYYGCPYYWTGPYLWGLSESPVRSVEVRPREAEQQLAAAETDEEGVHLRSLHAITNYSIKAKDGEIGHARDFLMEQETAQIRYMVVDTGSWWPGKKVLVARDWITEVSWAAMQIQVDLFREVIKTAPEYNYNVPIDSDYEKRLYGHYSRARYRP